MNCKGIKNAETILYSAGRTFATKKYLGFINFLKPFENIYI